MSLEAMLKRKRAKDVLSYTFKTDEIRLVPVGDIHFGVPPQHLDLRILKGTLEYILKREDTYMIGMGDYCDCALLNTLGEPYEAMFNPREQVDAITDLFQPLADKEKILGILTGNHERRVFRQTSFDPAEIIAKNLGVPYCDYSQFFKFKVRKHVYNIYATHGESRATTPGGKLNALLRLGNIAQADVYLMGHVHELFSIPRAKLMIDNRHNKLTYKKSYFVLTGHFLNYKGTYAERKGYQIGKKGVAKIKFFGDRWDIHVSV